MIQSMRDIFDLMRSIELVHAVGENHPLHQLVYNSLLYYLGETWAINDMNTQAEQEEFVEVYHLLENLYFNANRGISREEYDTLVKSIKLFEYMLITDPVTWGDELREAFDTGHRVEFIAVCRSEQLARSIATEFAKGTDKSIRLVHCYKNVIYLTMVGYTDEVRLCPAHNPLDGYMMAPHQVTVMENEVLGNLNIILDRLTCYKQKA